MTENLLLARLPVQVRDRFRSRFETIDLTRDRALFELGDAVRYAYFPQGGLLSLEAATTDGEGIELATVGAEGFVGVPILLRDDTAPYVVSVQVKAPAFRIRAAALHDELTQHPALQDVLLGYAARQLREISQAVLCHRAHSVLQRLCRRVLVAADRLNSQTLEMTHEDLARALGVVRSTVSEALVELQAADAVWSHHGRLLIRKRPMLEATACECYHAWREREREQDALSSRLETLSRSHAASPRR